MFSLSQGFAMPGATGRLADQSLAQASEQGNSSGFCGTCGSPLPSIAAFCSRCGTPKAITFVALAKAKAEAQAQPLVDGPCQGHGTPVGKPAHSGQSGGIPPQAGGHPETQGSRRRQPSTVDEDV